MKRKKKYFVDDSYLISLIDENNSNYETHRLSYEKMVKEGGLFFTSNFNLGLVFDYLKKNISPEVAEQFYHFALRTTALGDLKISWIGRKISKEAISLLLENPEKMDQMDLQLASNLVICKNKRIKYYLSDRDIDQILSNFNIQLNKEQ